MKAISKLTVKYQATIPREVRERLGLAKGDHVVFELDNHQHIVVRKAGPMDVDYLKSVGRTLTEWESREDDEAYRDL